MVMHYYRHTPLMPLLPLFAFRRRYGLPLFTEGAILRCLPLLRHYHFTLRHITLLNISLFQGTFATLSFLYGYYVICLYYAITPLRHYWLSYALRHADYYAADRLHQHYATPLPHYAFEYHYAWPLRHAITAAATLRLLLRHVMKSYYADAPLTLPRHWPLRHL